MDPKFKETLVLHAGESFKIDADVHGKPLPSIQWLKGDKELVNTKTNMEVEKLQEKHEYKFRICAVNKAGVGEHADGRSDPRSLAVPITAKDLVIEPDVRPAFHSYSIQVGQDLKVEIPISGRPIPTITWTKDGMPLKQTTRVNVIDSPKLTVLSIKEVTKEDSGAYEIAVANVVGQKSAAVEIITLDKPDPPKGPVKFDEISAESITLSWNPPVYTGGCQITNYIVHKRDTTTTVWETVSATVARTTLKVMKLKTGSEYQFRIFAENRYGQTIIVKRSSITLQWTKPEYDGGSKITGYVVEKRDLPEGRWMKASFTNITETQFTVTGLTEDQRYEFRVIARNAAGAVSKPSDSTGPITAKDEVELPRISMDPKYKDAIVVNAGETFRLEADVHGKPIPTILWLKGDKVLEDTARCEVRNTDFKALITVKDAIRVDGGQYILQASNVAGTKSVPITVKV
uniref:Titin n=1 Tax=Podarcis muralis TaxID=64176 RepID=A0A670HYT8_PODMU